MAVRRLVAAALTLLIGVGTTGNVLAQSAPQTGAPDAGQNPIGPPAVSYRLGAADAVAFSPDGKTLAFGTYGQVDLFDTSTWQVSSVCRNVVQSARSLAFSPDGSKLAIGCGIVDQSGIVLIWDKITGHVPLALKPAGDTIDALSFSPGGSRLLCGSSDYTVYYYSSLSASAQPTSLSEHSAAIRSVVLSPSPNFPSLSASMDHLVKLWDLKTGKTVANLDDSGSSLTGMALLPNNQIVAGNDNGALLWWQVSYNKKEDDWGGNLIRRNNLNDDGITALSTDADATRFIICEKNGHVSVWRSDGNRIADFTDAKEQLYAVALNPEGTIAAGCGRDGYLYIWDVNAKKLLQILAPPPLPKAKPVLRNVSRHSVVHPTRKHGG